MPTTWLEWIVLGAALAVLIVMIKDLPEVIRQALKRRKT